MFGFEESQDQWVASRLIAFGLEMHLVFKSRSITALFTTPGEGSSLEHTDLAISSLVVTWIFLRDIEIGGERNRGVFSWREAYLGPE